MRNVMCVICYDGSKFCGFATQKRKKKSLESLSIESITESKLDFKLSVQDFLESTLKRIGIDSKIIAAGRTDKGVHATFQVINFYTKQNTSQMPLEKIKKLLNDRLSPHIVIRKIYEVSLNFHARFSAKSRTYCYIFVKKDSKLLPFFSPYISRINFGSLDSIQRGLDLFIGTHDFSLFKKSGSESKNDIREIFSAKIFDKKLYNTNFFMIKIKANGFLRAQVRLMLNACFAYSLGHVCLKFLKAQIDNEISLNESLRELVPPFGLYLWKVEY